MAPNPGRMRTQTTLKLERPRNRFDPAFLNWKRRLIEEIRRAGGARGARRTSPREAL